MLPRLSLPLSDKVKHYNAIALHTIKRQPYGSCQLPITSTKHDHLIQQNIASCLDHITSQHALQKQVRRPLLCCCKFYVAATGFKQEPILPTHQNHNDSLSSWCCFNLHKDRAQPHSVQLKLEKLTPASHLCAKHVGRTSLGKRTRNVGPGRFIQQYRRTKV